MCLLYIKRLNIKTGSRKGNTEDYQEKSSVRVSNIIMIVDDHHIRFNPSIEYMKSIKKESLFVLGKIIKTRLNYTK